MNGNFRIDFTMQDAIDIDNLGAVSLLPRLPYDARTCMENMTTPVLLMPLRTHSHR